MNHAIYTGAAGAIAMDKRFDMISNNLANVNTTGFKKQRISFSDMLPLEDKSNPAVTNKNFSENIRQGVFNTSPFVNEVKTDFSQGYLKSTGNDLDLAISGEGFFMIKGKGNNVKFTRDGSFTLNNNGFLVTKKGEQVLDLQYNPIKLPTENVEFINIDEKGNIYVNDAYTAKIAVMDPDKTMLKRAGDNEYILNNNNIRPRESENFSIDQGFLEGSNVNIVKEMTSMIEIMRFFQANQKVITTIDTQLDQKAVNDVGRTV
jgi:flagellar basal-body rod protein FlgG